MSRVISPPWVIEREGTAVAVAINSTGETVTDVVVRCHDADHSAGRKKVLEHGQAVHAGRITHTGNRSRALEVVWVDSAGKHKKWHYWIPRT